MDWIHTDTSPEAERVLIDLYRRMSTVEKAQRLQQAMEAVEQLASARIRAQYGGISEEERRLRLAALRLPREMMIRAFGWDPEIEGY